MAHEIFLEPHMHMWNYKNRLKLLQKKKEEKSSMQLLVWICFLHDIFANLIELKFTRIYWTEVTRVKKCT